MALLKPQAGKFEPLDSDEIGAEAIPTALQKAQIQAAIREKEEAEEAAAAEAAQPIKAITTAKSTAVAKPLAMIDPFKALERAFPVTYKTFKRIKATNGNFLDNDTSKPMGDTIGMELISHQKNWVMSPGGDTDDQESLQFLKYSDDGKTTTAGEDLFECLRMAKEAGYDQAKISERVTLVGNLIFAGKLPDMIDQIVQIDLAPTSVDHFLRHRASTAYNLGKGKITAEGQEILKLECTVKTKGKMSWTEVVFSQYK
jgi:hypothetical protein